MNVGNVLLSGGGVSVSLSSFVWVSCEQVRRSCKHRNKLRNKVFRSRRRGPGRPVRVTPVRVR